MSRILSICSLALFLAVIAMGVPAAHAYTSGGYSTRDCPTVFTDIAGCKGYMNYQDWKAAQYGVGDQIGVGPATSGNATAFYTLDADNDGVLSMEEYCRISRPGFGVEYR